MVIKGMAAVFIYTVFFVLFFTETIAPMCDPYDNSGSYNINCVWGNWREWSSCSGKTRTRYRMGEDRVHHCRCDEMESQTQSCVVHGGWSSWSGWTSCTKSCGTGSQAHSRSCTNPRPRNGGKPCSGKARVERSCNWTPCPVDGGWSSWGVWSSCSHPCDVGMQGRSRTCTEPLPQHGGKTCSGAGNEKGVCNTHPCPVHGGWSTWSVSKPCSVTCGSGVEILSRTCTNPAPEHGGRLCQGAGRKSQACTRKPCPIHGGWSSWSVSTPCSVTCGKGKEILSRSCTNPAPKHGGTSCPGAGKTEQPCSRNHCPIHGGWSSWSISTPCKVTCGRGIELLSRSCTNPASKYGGKSCPGAKEKKQPCSRNPCPIHGGWSSWSLSTPCSVTCGRGVEIFSRFCTNPAPKYGGKSCPGARQRRQPCSRHPCPIHGGWSHWSVLIPCSVTCGSGKEIFSRSCTNPAPKHGGTLCPGTTQKEQACTRNPCPINGDWSVWGEWNSCSKSCGTGLQERSRSCTQPAPSFGGKPCEGKVQENRWCNTHSCPVDGGWSSWSTWTSCSQSCGTGFKERSRNCTQPAPSHGGKNCKGKARERHDCNTHSCSVDGSWSVWSSWSPCGKTCGGGVRERTRSCTNPPPFFGGKGCGTQNHESKKCAVNNCPVTCRLCRNSRKRKRNYCESDFVIRARVLKVSYNEVLQERKYRVKIIEEFKSKVKLKGRHDIFVLNDYCHCPKLVVREQYVIMGKVQQVSATNVRLLIPPRPFVWKWRSRMGAGLKSISNVCDN